MVVVCRLHISTVQSWHFFWSHGDVLNPNQGLLSHSSARAGPGPSLTGNRKLSIVALFNLSALDAERVERYGRA